MKTRTIKFTLAAAAVSLGLGLSACGSDDESNESSSTGTTTSATTTAPANAEAVKVSLTEMAIATTPSSVKAGNVAFDLTNDGAVVHEMVVIKTNKKAGDLPTDSSGKADETGAVGESEVEPGASDELDLKLAAGHYALICNLPGHYAAGMYTDFTVK